MKAGELSEIIAKEKDVCYIFSMILKIADEILKNINITPEQAKLDFAIGLYADNRTTLGQSARIASITQAQFLKELGKREISINYDIEEFNKDVETLKKLNLI